MRNYSNRVNREPISTRRAAIAEEIRTESEKPPTKKRKTVEFQDEIEKKSATTNEWWRLWREKDYYQEERPGI